MEFSFMASTVDEKNKLSQVRNKQFNLAKSLFAEARKVNVQTPQKEICNLLSKTSSYIVKNRHYIEEVQQLRSHLSHCLECKYNREDWAFEDLSYFLSKSKFLL